MRGETNLLALLELSSALLAGLLLGLALLEEGLWDENLVLGGNGTISAVSLDVCIQSSMEKSAEWELQL